MMLSNTEINNFFSSSYQKPTILNELPNQIIFFDRLWRIEIVAGIYKSWHSTSTMNKRK